MMHQEEDQAASETPKPEPRYMVGGIKALYVHGKSTKPIMTLSLAMAVESAKYLSKLDYGQFEIFELVRVAEDEHGELVRRS